MKKIKISENVLKLKSWYGIPISVWLVKDRDDIYLIDAGISLMSKEIIKAIKSFGTGNLKAIFLTHGHPDHVGAVTSILKKYDVPVYIGNLEIKYATGEIKYLDKKKKKVFLDKKFLTPINLFDDSSSDISAYHTPGHTPGHLVYYHNKDKVLIGGDLFTSKNGKLLPPMKKFTGNMNEAIESGEILKKIKPYILTTCHGGEVKTPHTQYNEYRRKYKK